MTFATRVERVAFAAIEELREAYRTEAACQIVHDSILRRGLADAHLVICDGEVAAYGGVWSEHFPGRVVEFHTMPRFRDHRLELFDRFLDVTGATEIEAQTNVPGMRELLRAFGVDAVEEKILFRDGATMSLAFPGAVFRRRRPADEGPEGAWVVALDGRVAAGGGVLTHYNPPYGDVYMEVRSDLRRRGIGGFLVQELRRVCHESGLVPAARCNPANIASRRTLERGGMVECGRLLAAKVGRRTALPARRR